MGPAGFTVIVRCADPRMEPFFSEPSIRPQMGLDERAQPLTEAYVANVGGLLPFVGDSTRRLVHDAALLIGLFGRDADRIVLTAHSTCGGYQDAVRGDESDVVARQEADLRATAQRMRRELPGVSVDCYYLDTDALTVRAVSE